MRLLTSLAFVLLLLWLLVPAASAATGGKIAGVVKDAKSGEPLAGAIVLVEGTSLGASTSFDGYYVILNVPPNSYKLKATIVGYAPLVKVDVRVTSDQTTIISFALTSQSIETKEIEIIAERPIVQKDISASRASLNTEEIQNLPIVSTTQILGLQAGIESGLTIRGGAPDQTAFIMNGAALRDERDNTPYTDISLTSIQEFQVQTGGFSAEFGNIRSGLVNVVTKEGDKSKYSLTALTRIKPAKAKHYGPAFNDPNTYWMRPYLDPAVCWDGTDQGGWDQATQNQYPYFQGWNSVSASLQPENYLSPEDLQKAFLYQHRKNLDIKLPDYDVDATLTGPFPVFAQELGNLRFLLSYRETREMYLIPLSTDSDKDYNAQFKINSDISSNMKLSIEGLISQSNGTASTTNGAPGMFRDPESIASQLGYGIDYGDARIFSDNFWSITKVNRNFIAAKLTHVITPRTYYEVSLSRFASGYETNPPRARDTTKIFTIGEQSFDEAPLGWTPVYSTGVDGMRMGSRMALARDSSKVAAYTLKADLNSQLDEVNNLQAGVEFVYTDNDVNYAYYDPILISYNTQSAWHTFPVRGAAYVQDKLEFEGMVANLGLRLDYSNPNSTWYEYTDLYTKAFSSALADQMDALLQKKKVSPIVELSPRLGIAFPISENSKIFFNYGVFRSLPRPENLYMLQRLGYNNQVSQLAQPSNPFPKTVAYELGYEHNLIDQFLVRLTGYYKNVSYETRPVNYINYDNTVNYTRDEPNSYQDVRGFELTINKNRGNWVRGFVNYTYMVATSGWFGFSTYYERSTVQANYERSAKDMYQEKPVPAPYARANIDLFTPIEFGPQTFGMHFLGDWRINILANWRAGDYETWTGGVSGIPGVQNNIQWKDYYNIDLRISKNFRFGSGLQMEIFADISNLLDTKHMTQYGFLNADDKVAYLQSLHMPEDVGGNRFHYFNAHDAEDNGYYITGNDKPGDYRTVPYEAYDPMDPDAKHRQSVLDNKAYIVMPKLEYLTFLNPRAVFWGLRLSVDIN